MTNELKIIGHLSRLWLLFPGVGCTTPENNEENESTTEALTSGLTNMNGFSGLAQVDELTYLAVHDELVYEDGIRLTLVRLEDGAIPTYSAVVVDNWVDSEGPSSDLESHLCRTFTSETNSFLPRQDTGRKSTEDCFISNWVLSRIARACLELSNCHYSPITTLIKRGTSSRDLHAWMPVKIRCS